MRSTFFFLAVSCLTVLTGAQSVSITGRCGAQSALTCKGSSFGNCCSLYNYCGSTSAYCSTGCQSKYGTCKPRQPSAASQPESKVTTDGTCGGKTGFTCSGSRHGSCCSQYGYCGKSSAYCGIGCDSKFGTCSSAGFPTSTRSSRVALSSTLATSTRASSATASPASANKVSSNSRCGNAYKASPGGMTCQGSAYGDCCSQYSYCGRTSSYCGIGCQEGFGKCNSKSSSSRSSTTLMTMPPPSSSTTTRTESITLSSSSVVTVTYEDLESSSSITLSSSSMSTAEPITSSTSSTGTPAPEAATIVSSSTIDVPITSDSSSISPIASDVASSSSETSSTSPVSLPSSIEAATLSSSTSVNDVSETPTPASSSSSMEATPSASETSTSTPETSALIETPSPSLPSSTIENTSSTFEIPTSTPEVAIETPIPSLTSSTIEPTLSAVDSPTPTPEVMTPVEIPTSSSTSSCVPTPTNYLTNGNFESGSISPFVSQLGASFGVTTSITAEAAHSEKYGLHFQQTVRTNQPWVNQLVQTNVKIPSGTVVNCSAWFNVLRTPVIQAATVMWIDGILCYQSLTTQNGWVNPSGTLTVYGDSHTVIWRATVPINNYNYLGPLFDADEISVTPLSGPDAVAAC